jgi:hypothetical protein
MDNPINPNGLRNDQSDGASHTRGASKTARKKISIGELPFAVLLAIARVGEENIEFLIE